MSNNESSKSKDVPDDSVLSKIPSELRLTYKWDGCVERALAHTSVGTIVGGLASVVLFSKYFLYSPLCRYTKFQLKHYYVHEYSIYNSCALCDQQLLVLFILCQIL